MRILLSTIGSRGDVQPILALALELRALGHDPRIVAPPNFGEWIESFGLTCVPIGPDVRKFSMASAGKPILMDKAMRQKLVEGTVREQFRVLKDAVQGCDAIVGANALQVAAPSIAESFGVPYVFASYCAGTLPSWHHPPPKIGGHHSYSLPDPINRLLWWRDERGWNSRWAPTLNDERAKLGLGPVRDVRGYVLTARPWLAADPALGPAPSGMDAVQTGAWLLPSDPTPLPDDLERFLGAGAPPVYFGFGSMRTPEDATRAVIDVVRSLGRRAIVSRGWANLEALGAIDCLAIGDVDHVKLLPRVAAVVHHGGAGTTTAVARSGKPQVVVPHGYDQFYWAHRVRALGIGVSGPIQKELTAAGLRAALDECLRPEIVERAQALAPRVKLDGAQVAARLLVDKIER